MVVLDWQIDVGSMRRLISLCDKERGRYALDCLHVWVGPEEEGPAKGLAWLEATNSKAATRIVVGCGVPDQPFRSLVRANRIMECLTGHDDDEPIHVSVSPSHVEIGFSSGNVVKIESEENERFPKISDVIASRKTPTFRFNLDARLLLLAADATRFTERTHPRSNVIIEVPYKASSGPIILHAGRMESIGIIMPVSLPDSDKLFERSDDPNEEPPKEAETIAENPSIESEVAKYLEIEKELEETLDLVRTLKELRSAKLGRIFNAVERQGLESPVLVELAGDAYALTTDYGAIVVEKMMRSAPTPFAAAPTGDTPPSV